MKITFLLLMLSFIGCSHTNVAEQVRLQSEDLNVMINSNKYLIVKSMFDHEAFYIKTIPEAAFKVDLKNLLNSIATISFAENACAQGQVACSDQSHDGTILKIS